MTILGWAPEHVSDDCPEWEREADAFLSDPITAESGCGGEFLPGMRRRHEGRCRRCLQARVMLGTAGQCGSCGELVGDEAAAELVDPQHPEVGHVLVHASCAEGLLARGWELA